MDASRRRQALVWLEREDLTPEERGALEAFAREWRTAPELSGAERRAGDTELRRFERELLEDASRKGISLYGLHEGPNQVLNTAELLRRIGDDDRSRREHHLWIGALVSALASGASAVGAWIAVLCAR